MKMASWPSRNTHYLPEIGPEIPCLAVAVWRQVLCVQIASLGLVEKTQVAKCPSETDELTPQTMTE